MTQTEQSLLALIRVQAEKQHGIVKTKVELDAEQWKLFKLICKFKKTSTHEVIRDMMQVYNDETMKDLGV